MGAGLDGTRVAKKGTGDEGGSGSGGRWRMEDGGREEEGVEKE